MIILETLRQGRVRVRALTLTSGKDGVDDSAPLWSSNSLKSD